MGKTPRDQDLSISKSEFRLIAEHGAAKGASLVHIRRHVQPQKSLGNDGSISLGYVFQVHHLQNGLRQLVRQRPEEADRHGTVAIVAIRAPSHPEYVCRRQKDSLEPFKSSDRHVPPESTIEILQAQHGGILQTMIRARVVPAPNMDNILVMRPDSSRNVLDDLGRSGPGTAHDEKLCTADDDAEAQNALVGEFHHDQEPAWTEQLARVGQRGNEVGRGMEHVGGHDKVIGPVFKSLLGRVDGDVQRLVDHPVLVGSKVLLSLAEEAARDVGVCVGRVGGAQLGENAPRRTAGAGSNFADIHPRVPVGDLLDSGGNEVVEGVEAKSVLVVVV
ncbi:hypothetical protein E5D57_007721 [Metarhizium anisopliae]|nr:hypothetical protein E5D57_007721 [Metarhizium anisopliae]